MKYGVAIIGIGNIAKEHLDGYLNLNDRCEVKVLCDIFEDKANDFKNKYSLDVEITDNYKTLLDRDDIHIVSICLPPSFHQEITCAFLEKNKHVLCEKPMAASLAEAEEMINSMTNSTALLSIVSQTRFSPIMKVKQLLDNNTFGKIVSMRINSMWYRGSNYYKVWWRGTWDKDGGGCTANQSIHQIDIMAWLLGEPVSVYSTIKNYLHTNSELEDTSLSIIEFKDKIAQLGISLNDHDEKQEFFIQCEKASISIPWGVKCMKQLENGFPVRDEETEKKFNDIYKNLDDLELEGHKAQIKNLIDAIDGKAQLLVTARDGYIALEIVNAIYKSALYKKLVELPIPKDDEFMHKETIVKKMPRFYEKKISVDNIVGEITI